MTGKVLEAELSTLVKGDSVARTVAFIWDEWNRQRRQWKDEVAPYQ